MGRCFSLIGVVLSGVWQGLGRGGASLGRQRSSLLDVDFTQFDVPRVDNSSSPIGVDDSHVLILPTQRLAPSPLEASGPSPLQAPSPDADASPPRIESVPRPLFERAVALLRRRLASLEGEEVTVESVAMSIAGGAAIVW